MMFLAASLALCSAFQAPASAMRVSQLPAATVSPVRAAPLMMADEPSDKAVVIGAAAVGGVAGVYLFGDLGTSVFLSVVCAYASTTSSGFGKATASAGSFAAKAYSKTLEINEQYDVLPKAKGAADTVTTAASNLNNNYGITAKIDEQLKLSQAVDKATVKFDELKGSVTDKVDDLKSKASA
jgi:hypothetical protein